MEDMAGPSGFFSYSECDCVLESLCEQSIGGLHYDNESGTVKEEAFYISMSQYQKEI